PIYNQEGFVTGVKLSELDLLQYQRNQKELFENKERFQSFARTASDPIFVVDQQTLKILYANPAACRQYGYSLNEFLRLKANHMMPDPNAEPEPRYPEPGKVYTCFHRKKNGELFPAEVSIGVFEQNEQVLITTIVRDISERQKAQELLQESEERFRLITENAHDFIAMINMEGKYVYVSPSHMALLGYTKEELLQIGPLDLLHPDDAKHGVNWSIANEGEFRIRKADGTYIWLEGSSYTITIRDVLYVIGVARDISGRRHTEDKLRESLQEKNVLLAEIHHRVRNNLAIISSLLRLQAANLNDELSRSLLQESQNRIRSMLLIHEKLYQSETFARIDFRVYVQDLVNFIQKTYPLQGTCVTIQIDMDEIYLELTSAVPCGLILNELLSNAYKYAFQNREFGHIYVSAHKKNKEVTFAISDDGVGLNPQIDLNNLKSLGLNLVQKLTNQLEGNLEITTRPGTSFVLTFNTSR
ncbi:MAG: PAS domain S-box protein, partial [Hymenobacteraceae bacterium]|nr:PAS domain S-box protein [Hymenobacteraceae bacterium]